MDRIQRKAAIKAIKELRQSATAFEEQAMTGIDFIIPGSELSFNKKLLDSAKQIRETIKFIKKELNSG